MSFLGKRGQNSEKIIKMFKKKKHFSKNAYIKNLKHTKVA